MINFQEEVSKFQPSHDVDDIEKILAGMDLTDMNDIMMQMLEKPSDSETRN